MHPAEFQEQSKVIRRYPPNTKKFSFSEGTVFPRNLLIINANEDKNEEASYLASVNFCAN